VITYPPGYIADGGFGRKSGRLVGPSVGSHSFRAGGPAHDSKEFEMSDGTVQEVDTKGFDEVVSTSEVPVVVDFWAPWCGPCRMVGPVLEQLASDHADKVNVIKVNVDVNQELAARYGIMSIPTVIMFDGGELKTQLIGARNQKDYEKEFGLA
jgi:thioredoxin